MLLDGFMPAYDFREAHGVRVSAEVEDIWKAIKEVSARDVWVVRLLFAIRGLPARLIGKPGHAVAGGEGPLLGQLLRTGFVLLAETPRRELVLGTAGRFWQLDGGIVRGIENAAEFLAFDRPGYARAAINFEIRATRRAGVFVLRTETRVAIADAPARRKFGLYWWAIYPGSALIRRAWLLAIRRRARSSSR